MKTTSITIWYRRGPLGYELLSGACLVQERASGVRTTLWSMFGTGEGPLGYELLSGTCLVQERASGVRATLRNVFGTGEGLLGYELLSGKCLVQERGLWGTNYTSKCVWYRRGASDVRNAPQNTLGTGKWVLVYRINEKRIPVQGLNFIRLTITILTEIFDNYEELQ